jgi:outer membrane protein TolC
MAAIAIAAMALWQSTLVVRATDSPTMLSLGQAIERARTAGFDVRMSQADAREQAARAVEARAGLLPSIGISGTTMNGGISQLGMPVAQQTYLLASASVPLVLPSNIAKTRAASLDAGAAGYQSAAASNDQALTAAQQYERALLADAIVAARTATVEYQRRNVRDAGERYRLGKAPRYQLAQAEATLAAAMQSAEDAAADRDEALTNLKALLDFELDVPIALTDSLAPIALPNTLADYRKRALVQRPEVLAAARRLDSAKAQLDGARAGYLPNVSGSVQTYNGHSNPSLGSSGYQIGVTASLPVFDGGERPAAVHVAHAEMDKAQAGLEQAQLYARRDVENAWREFQAAQRDLEAARVQKITAAEALRVARLRVLAGKGIALEALSALADDTVARENELRAVARLNDAVFGVHHAAGDEQLF